MIHAGQSFDYGCGRAGGQLPFLSLTLSQVKECKLLLDEMRVAERVLSFSFSGGLPAYERKRAPKTSRVSGQLASVRRTISARRMLDLSSGFPVV